MRVSTTTPTTDPTTTLSALPAEYTRKVNSALAAGRDDLAGELAEAYADESLRLITDSPALPRTSEEDDVHVTATLKTLLRRFDRYTLEAFRPAAPYRNELVRSGR